MFAPTAPPPPQFHFCEHRDRRFGDEGSSKCPRNEKKDKRFPPHHFNNFMMGCPEKAPPAPKIASSTSVCSWRRGEHNPSLLARRCHSHRSDVKSTMRAAPKSLGPSGSSQFLPGLEFVVNPRFFCHECPIFKTKTIMGRCAEDGERGARKRRRGWRWPTICPGTSV